MNRTILSSLAAVVVATAAFAMPQAAPASKPAETATTKAAETPKPVIDIVNKIQDFGTVPKGQMIKATFEVKNSGDAPLEINQVRPTCGCTVANFTRTIAPGGTGSVNADVDTTAFTGPITKAVLVFSNDPTSPQVNLVIKADVRAFVEVLPRPLLIFTNVLQGEPATQKLVLASADGSDFKIESAAASSGPYEISYRELPEKERIPDRKGSQWEISVTVPANAPEGMLDQKILVRTTSPKAPEVTINVTGAVRPVVQVMPSAIDFGTVSADALIGHNVLVINNRQGAELQLSDAKVDNPNFTVEVNQLQAGQRYQVQVSMNAGTPKGEQKGTLTIATNDPLRKTLTIPITAVVQ